MSSYKGIEVRCSACGAPNGRHTCRSCGNKPRGFNRTGAYDYVFDIAAYMKRRRKLACVILDTNLLPRPCAVCKKPVTEDNRTDILPARNGRPIRVAVMHYACAWSSLLNKVYTDLYERVA